MRPGRLGSLGVVEAGDSNGLTGSNRVRALRERLADRFAALRSSQRPFGVGGAERLDIPAGAESGELLGMVINALGNGLALEKLADPDAVPDTLYGDILVLILQALEALAPQTNADFDSAPQETAAEKSGGAHG